MSTDITFAAAFRRLLAAKKLTQAELAARLGVAQPHVARWLNGGREPSWSTVCRIADALGVSVGQFRT